MAKQPREWKLVDSYPISEYECGVKAGDRVRLRKDLVIHDHRSKRTGEVKNAGEIWTVIQGAGEPPVVLWLREPDGSPHTWDDDAGFWEWFERVAE